jgi:hypothetical protein
LIKVLNEDFDHATCSPSLLLGFRQFVVGVGRGEQMPVGVGGHRQGMRPTGLGAGIDKDRPDYTIFSGGWAVGRIYVLIACAGSGRSPSPVR